ncbi:putative beta-galactosidase [Lupinus albus]|uniref:Putative beta-galactosidase n=1 Tax=Lupinus albus TaxID=3870 RepID=A0A6A4QAG1_LUPAL|nr:putative beta-galactosidase [Lupinus albus]
MLLILLLTLAMASIVIISLQIQLTSQRCGQKLGLTGLRSLEVQFLIDLLKTWGIICQVLHVSWERNFGRTAGGPFIATSYDYDAPMDEYVDPITF